MKKRTLGKLLFGFVVALVMFGAMSCTIYTCPTYSKAPVAMPSKNF
jgi:hypothetical protein